MLFNVVLARRRGKHGHDTVAEPRKLGAANAYSAIEARSPPDAPGFCHAADAANYCRDWQLNTAHDRIAMCAADLMNMSRQKHSEHYEKYYESKSQMGAPW